MKGPAKTLVWGEADFTTDDMGCEITSIGIYNASTEVEKTEDGLYSAKDLPPAEPSTCPIRSSSSLIGNGVFYAHASLNNVYRVRIFQDEDSSLCKGLLFEYDDGSQQAVGQCKFGLLQEKEIAFPS
jgi:hypothetical protein